MEPDCPDAKVVLGLKWPRGKMASGQNGLGAKMAHFLNDPDFLAINRAPFPTIFNGS